MGEATIAPQENASTPPHEEPTPILIDTMAEAAKACAFLRTHKVLAMDMEGAPLETRTCLLQLAASPREVYIFDLMVLSHHELFNAAHLLPILTDPGILKLCYDVRGDGAALYLQHGLQVHGLYDLQIVFTSLHQSPDDPFLKGLHRAVERLKSVSAGAACAFAKRKASFRSTLSPATTFVKRPLDHSLLAYAAWDVAYLMDMFRLWSPYVAEHAVLAATAERLARHIRRRRRCCSTLNMTMSRVDFVPVRAKRLCFVVPSRRL